MNEQENLRVTQEGYAAFGRGDIPALLNTYTEDVEYVIPGPPDIITYAGTYRGAEQVAQFFSLLNDAIDYELFEPREFVAQGNKVVVLGYARGRVKITDHRVEERWAHVLTLREGKVMRFEAYSDTAATVAAFTMPPRTAGGLNG